MDENQWPLSSSSFWSAVQSRDHRFDGRFFVGVTTTKIYCRPICPAKPHRKNVKYFRSAAEAEANGFRACLRCRPESAPQSAAWQGRSAVVARALRSIIASHDFEDSLGEERFAEQFGMSARHLRRIFVETIGCTPKQIANTHRLGFARKLLLETQMPITEVAFASGFNSIRRFNEVFKEKFDVAPKSLRERHGKPSDNSNHIELQLSYRPPFSWLDVSRYLRGHLLDGIESIDEKSFSRVFRIGDTVGAFKIEPHPSDNAIILKVTANQSAHLLEVVRRVREMLDLDFEFDAVNKVLNENRHMAKLLQKHSSIRLVRGWDPFETSIGIILGQLVSTERARQMFRQLVVNHGEQVKNEITGESSYLFPTAEALSKASLENVGTTGARKAAIREFARLVHEGSLHFRTTQDLEKLREQILSIKGVGPWTVEFICMRALGDPDAFPDKDLILHRVMKLKPNLNIEKTRPWRSYAALYLWREYAAKLSNQQRVKPKGRMKRVKK